MNKRILREIFLEKRLSMSPKEWNRRNDLMISAFFKEVDLSDIKVLHTFLPIKKKREPDTWKLVNKLWENYPDILVAVSKTLWKARSMKNYILTDRNHVVENGMGIPEPASGSIIDDSTIDMVLVPLITFDKAGNRLGYGKGFYDAFFNTCRKDALKVGLSLSTPLDHIPYMEAHDIKLDKCVTPYGVMNFTI